MTRYDLLLRASRHLPAEDASVSQSLLTAFASVATAGVLRVLLQPYLHGGVPFITFFPAVAVASVWGGPLGGVVAVALSLVAAAYGWVPPFAGGRPVYPFLAALLTFAVSSALLVFLAALLRALLLEIRAAEQRATVTAREMKHRVSNLTAMASAIVRRTASGAESVEEFSRLMQARLQALGCAQDILFEAGERLADLGQLLQRVFEPFPKDRILVAGPPAGVPPQLCSGLALLFNELATNATKYGALSGPSGRVEVSWSCTAGTVTIDWRETGGPRVSPPTRSGFGTTLLTAALPEPLGRVSVDYPAGGVRCKVEYSVGARPSADPPSWRLWARRSSGERSASGAP